MKGPLFFAKILLFGEYGIIEDSKGLSIPYNFYRGALKIPKNKTDYIIESNKTLIDFAKYYMVSCEIPCQKYLIIFI